MTSADTMFFKVWGVVSESNFMPELGEVVKD
jgi:hypothetical protein